jgi:hypothetical protein
VFQQRTVDETITVHEDGSATVQRTVKIDNPTPPYVGLGPDTKFGYNTRWATNLVISLMPPGSTIKEEPTVRRSGTVSDGVDQAGRTFAQAAITSPPNGSAQVAWVYDVPRAAAKVGDLWRLSDVVVPQNAVNPFLYRVTVVAPDGWTVRRVDDSQLWYVAGQTGYLQLSIDAPTTLQLDIAAPGV